MTIFRLLIAAGAAGLLCAAAPSARAESLVEALALAYGTNPTLKAERANLRATDELVPQALSDWRPTVTFSSEIGKRGVETETAFFSSKENRTPEDYTLTLTQPLFRGGRTLSNTESAENLVRAGRAELMAVEQDVLLEAVTAYVDVLRDQSVLDLNINNEQVLTRQLEATRDRFEVGEVTRTDVSQAEARLSQARADRIAAEGDLAVSRSIYERVIGTAPGTLEWPPLAGELPASVEESAGAARARHPSVEAARFREQAAQSDVWTATGTLLPEISLEGRLNRGEDQSSRDSVTESAAIVAQLVVPIYQQGAEYSRIRESKERAGQRRLEVDEAERAVVEEAIQAWKTLEAAQAQIVAFRDQVAASGVALEGVQQEALVGLRTVLDVLDAEQELFTAKVNLVRAQRDTIVSSYRLASATGHLTAAELGLAVEAYDPNRYYDQVRDSLWGVGGD